MEQIVAPHLHERLADNIQTWTKLFTEPKTVLPQKTTRTCNFLDVGTVKPINTFSITSQTLRLLATIDYGSFRPQKQKLI